MASKLQMNSKPLQKDPTKETALQHPKYPSFQFQRPFLLANFLTLQVGQRTVPNVNTVSNHLLVGLSL